MEGKKEIKEASEGTQVIQTLWCYCVQQSEQRLGDQRDHQNNRSYPLCRASESEEQSLLGPTETWATLMFMHWYKKKPDKGVQCQTFTRTGSGPPNLPIKVHSKYRNMNSIKLHEQRKRWEVWVDGVIRDRRPACIDIHSNTDNKLKTTTEQVSAVVTHGLESLWILEPGASLLLMGTFF